MDHRDYRDERDGFGDSSGASEGTNRQHKDRLFKAIFGSPERKELTLELYNAINGSAYTNPEDIELTTIDDVVYMGMKNDVSFLLDQVMNLWEQQSTANQNMPLRFLLYYAHVMERHVNMLDPKSGSIYANTVVELPTPQMVLFYNGQGRMPEYLYLSDAFKTGRDPDVQVRVRVMNIRSGQDRILEACKPLQDYTTFVESFHQHRAVDGINDRDAASMAIRELSAGAVKHYLKAHESEVLDMLLTEYDEEKTMKAIYYEGERAGLEQGLEQGVQQGLTQGLRSLLRMAVKNGVPVAEILDSAADMGITDEADLRARAAALGIQLPDA